MRKNKIHDFLISEVYIKKHRKSRMVATIENNDIFVHEYNLIRRITLTAYSLQIVLMDKKYYFRLR